MGAIQTALSKLIGAVSGVASVSAKIKEHERQVNDKKIQAPTEKEGAVEEKAKKLNKSDFVESKAYKIAQERGLASPKRMIFDERGRPIGTYEEIGTLLAGNSLSGTLEARLRGNNAVKSRKQLLEERSKESGGK